MKLGIHIKKNEPSLHLFIHLVNNNRMEKIIITLQLLDILKERQKVKHKK
jgi:hypothetical protein